MSMSDNFGQDGTPHLTYFDADTQLSFVYDTKHKATVAVSHGGYAEAVIDTFDIYFDIERVEETLLTFARYCRAYVAGWRYRANIKENA